MKKTLLTIIMLIALAGSVFAKVESGSYDAQSVVAYGQGPSGIVPIKVDADGYIYGVGGSSQWEDGASSAIYYNDGNVGIGSSVPGAVLDVDGSLKVQGAGNTGFGTTSPVAKLQVGAGTPTWTLPANSVYVDGGIEVDDNIYLGSPGYQERIFKRYYGDGLVNDLVSPIDSSVFKFSPNSTMALNVYAYSYGLSLGFKNTATESMEIHGWNASKNAGAGGWLAFLYFDANTDYITATQFRNNADDDALIIQNTAGENTFVWRTEDSTRHLIYSLGSGNIGVGTTAPTQKLQVIGTVRADGYQSSDGTAGATVTTCTGFKNGLCISGS